MSEGEGLMKEGRKRGRVKGVKEVERQRENRLEGGRE